MNRRNRRHNSYWWSSGQPLWTEVTEDITLLGEVPANRYEPVLSSALYSAVCILLSLISSKVTSIPGFLMHSYVNSAQTGGVQWTSGPCHKLVAWNVPAVRKYGRWDCRLLVVVALSKPAHKTTSRKRCHQYKSTIKITFLGSSFCMHFYFNLMLFLNRSFFLLFSPIAIY